MHKTLRNFILYGAFLLFPFIGTKAQSQDNAPPKNDRDTTETLKWEDLADFNETSLTHDNSNFRLMARHEPIVPIDSLGIWLQEKSDSLDGFVLGEAHVKSYRRNMEPLVQKFYDAGVRHLFLELEEESVNEYLDESDIISKTINPINSQFTVVFDSDSKKRTHRYGYMHMLSNSEKYDQLMDIDLNGYVDQVVNRLDETVLNEQTAEDNKLRRYFLFKGIEAGYIPFDRVSVAGIFNLYIHSEELGIPEEMMDRSLDNLFVNYQYRGGLVDYLKVIKKAHELGMEYHFIDRNDPTLSHYAEQLRHRYTMVNIGMANRMQDILDDKEGKSLVIIGRGHTGEMRRYAYNNTIYDYSYQFASYSLEDALEQRGLNFISIDIGLIELTPFELKMNAAKDYKQGIFMFRENMADYELILVDTLETPMMKAKNDSLRVYPFLPKY